MPNSLCPTSEIQDPGSKAFHIENDDVVADIFVVHKNARFYAFINSCPHTGANLEWLEDQFLDMENVFIQCSTHGALFEIDTGLCVAGPCVGQGLKKLRLDTEDKMLVVYI